MARFESSVPSHSICRGEAGQTRHVGSGFFVFGLTQLEAFLLSDGWGQRSPGRYALRPLQGMIHLLLAVFQCRTMTARVHISARCGEVATCRTRSLLSN